jgi:chromosome segregation ATPase
MKTLVAVLSILVALLALAFWKRDSSAGANLQNAGAALAAVSNKLAEATMQVTHQEQLAAVARSGMDDCARQLAAISNTVVTLNIDLARSRSDIVAARAGAQDLQARATAAETQSASLSGKVEELAAQNRNLNAVVEQTRSNAVQHESARSALANEAECLKVEKLELVRRLNDPNALRLQLRRLKTQAQSLELHPNGSVGLLTAPH